MEFKSNINCGSCIASVKKTMDTLVGEGKWEVDTANPDKILTVATKEVTADEVIQKLKRVGFTAELKA
jgi:copper chaperone